MKLLLTLTCAFFVLFAPPLFAGEYKIEPGDTISITKAKEGNTSYVITKPWEHGELYRTFVVGDTAYMDMVVGISQFAVADMWKNMRVLKATYPDVKKIEVIMESGGGGALDGFGLVDLIGLLNEQYEVNAHAVGIIGSAAVVAFLAFEYRTCGPGTTFMVHEPKLFKYLSSESVSDIRSQNEMLKMITDRYNELVARQTKLTVDKINELCCRTTYFGAKDALEWGFVHELK